MSFWNLCSDFFILNKFAFMNSECHKKGKPIWVYCILSYVEFGPSDLNHRKGRSHNYKILNWAEVKTWSVVSAHFGQFDGWYYQNKYCKRTMFLDDFLIFPRPFFIQTIHLETSLKCIVWLRPFFMFPGSFKSILKAFQNVSKCFYL